MEVNKYNKSKIYKIVDNNYTKAYYGSTTQQLSQRMALHRSSYKNGVASTSAKLLFEEFGLDNCKIELVEEVCCTSKDQLARIEGKYIKENECVNKQIAGQTQREYNEKNKDKISAYKKLISSKQSAEEKENLLLKNRDYIKK